jgi:putative ABC transport system permease protein
MDRLRQILAEALRVLRHDPGHALAAILTLALGVGAIAALAAVVDGVLLRPLPYRSPERLVTVLHGPTTNQPMSPADYQDYRRLATSFESMAAAQAWGANLSADGRTERVPALQVTGTLFSLLGRAPLVGRTIDGDDESANARVVVLGHRTWVRRFGARRSIVGQAITINGEPYTVIGVMPADFRFAPFWQTGADAWVPLSLADRANDRGGRSLRVFARLGPAVTLESARAELETLNARLARDFPETNAGLVTGATLLEQKSLAGVRPLVTAIFALAVGLMLIAVVNLAMLVVARATARRGDRAIREALGASAARIAGAALAEATLIGVAGTGAGVLLAAGGTRVLIGMLPPESLPPHTSVDLSPAVIAAAVTASLVALVAATLIPHRWTRGTPADVLRSTRSATGDRRVTQIRGVLVGAEVTLAFVLAASAILLAQSVVHLGRVELGFDPSRVEAISVSLDGATSATPETRTAFFFALVDRLRAIPGVAAVSAINHLPLAGDLWMLGYQVEGAPPPRAGEEPRAAYRVVMPDYFAAMRQPVRLGRAFDRSDRAGALPVVVINQQLARRHWPQGDALGKRIRLGEDWLTVVGIVGDVPQSSLVDAIEGEVYLPLAQRQIQAATRMPMTLVLRTASDAHVQAAVRDAVWRLDSRAAVYDGVTLVDVLAAETWRERLAATVSSVFATVALLLAAVGISSVVGYAVTRRRREFGVRLALGATARDVAGLAVREAAVPVGAGLGAGLAIVLAVSQGLSALMAGQSASDPLALALAATALLSVAIAAAWRPAARAARIDPGTSLRDS